MHNLLCVVWLADCARQPSDSVWRLMLHTALTFHRYRLPQGIIKSIVILFRNFYNYANENRSQTPWLYVILGADGISKLTNQNGEWWAYFMSACWLIVRKWMKVNPIIVCQFFSWKICLKNNIHWRQKGIIRTRHLWFPYINGLGIMIRALVYVTLEM